MVVFTVMAGAGVSHGPWDTRLRARGSHNVKEEGFVWVVGKWKSASAVHPCMLGFQNSLESSLADVYKREAARATLRDAVEEGHAPLTHLEDAFKAAREELRGN